MGFPFNYKGFVKCPDDVLVTWFQDQFLAKAKEQFEAAKAEVALQENSLSFRTTLRAFPYWFNKEAASLAHIPKGTLYFQPAERKINYVLNFKVPVVIFTIGILGFLGSFFIFVVNGPIFSRISIIFIAWFFMVLVTYCGGILGFKSFLRRLFCKL